MPLTNVQTEPRMPPLAWFLMMLNGGGKTKTAAAIPNAIMLCSEEGAEQYPVARIKIDSLPDFTRALHELEHETHDYEVAVIDTVNRVETLVHDFVCERANVNAITDLGFGKGVDQAKTIMGSFHAPYDRLRKNKGMSIVLLSQVEVKKFSPPDSEEYDRWQPSYHQKAWAQDVAWADVVSFGTMKTAIKEEKGAFGSTRRRAISTGQRVMRQDLNPAYIAKSRYDIPAELPLSWDALVNAISEGVKT